MFSHANLCRVFINTNRCNTTPPYGVRRESRFKYKIFRTPLSRELGPPVKKTVFSGLTTSCRAVGRILHGWVPPGGGGGYEHLRHERLAGTGIYSPREKSVHTFQEGDK